jgi:hypothetical protein
MINKPFYSDPIVEKVREKLLQRSRTGQIKYGVGLDRDDMVLLDWMKHLQEELMDAILYIERIATDIERVIDDGK